MIDQHPTTLAHQAYDRSSRSVGIVERTARRTHGTVFVADGSARGQVQAGDARVYLGGRCGQVNVLPSIWPGGPMLVQPSPSGTR